MSAPRTSSVHEQLAALHPQWETRLGMRVATSIDHNDASKLEAVGFADLSYLPRFGLKGPQASAWLQSLGIAAPETANAWAALPAGGVIARLGRSEFFLEDAAAGTLVAQVREALGRGLPGTYPVIRQDAGFALAGARANELLVQVCNVNFEAFGREEKVAVMTQMIGVSVLAIRTSPARVPCYRLWCDPTFAPYFRGTLCAIAEELGGGAVGADAVPR